ncbi:hemin uptake protein HemP [Marinicella pacifica]|uniref:hemin uptake protein HemP n=1 Tax=Marinicella pacifica TaxID=1171543 RepID=UPI00166C971B
MKNSRKTLSRAATKLHAKLGLSTCQLFKDRNVIPIRHDKDMYYLRLTKNNKVILTK